MDPITLLKLMLPDFLVDYFEIISVDNSEENLHLYFEEKAKPPKEFDNIELASKDLTDEITIQDFPLRGKFVYLHIKRRRWTNKNTGEIVKRDWNLVVKETRMTQEFASFLKEINR
ncbi:ISAon1 family transposase N-terminal region protein [Flavobacterium columnare]|uniref:ISAon1 family transposase N-terminal region protein n=1 Tax=Flavobacterium columnare TaxID=996 RepID=UPI000D1A17B9|nr:transposase [Flavobacterium columnare]PTD13912.1 transposase [Flavobacterium columnare]